MKKPALIALVLVILATIPAFATLPTFNGSRINLTGPIYTDNSSGGALSGVHGGSGTTPFVIQSHTQSCSGNPSCSTIFFDAFNETTSNSDICFNFTRNNTKTSLFSISCNGNITTTGTTTIQNLSVPGTLNVGAILAFSNNASGTDYIHFGTTICPGNSSLTWSYNTTPAISGIAPSAWGNYCGTNGWIDVVDASGDMAIKGSFFANGNIYAAGSAQFPGSVSTGPLSVSGNASVSGSLSVGGNTLSFPLPISLGGTGSSTQNFVDLSSNQTINGNKTFTGVTTTSGVNVGGLLNLTQNLTNGNYMNWGSSICPGNGGLAWALNTNTVLNGVAASAWGNYCASNGWISAMDTSGDFTIKGQLDIGGPSTSAWVNISPNPPSGGSVDYIHLGTSVCPGTNPMVFTINPTYALNGIAAAALGFYCGTSGLLFTIDTNGNSAFKGNMYVGGNVTAANFYTGSRRAWKTDIRPFTFDPLRVLEQTDFKQYQCKTWQCGKPHTQHIGIIADDTPSQISGPHHDHNDVEALATIDGAAIVELAKQCQLNQHSSTQSLLQFGILVLVVWNIIVTLRVFHRD